MKVWPMLRQRGKRPSLNAVLPLVCALTVAIGLTMAWQGYQQRYRLGTAQMQLLSGSPIKADQIKEKNGVFSYNQIDASKGLQQSLTIATGANQSSKKPYQATLAKAGQGSLEFGDGAGSLSFELEPLFDRQAGKLQGDHIVYPDEHGAQQVYTYMRNGVKEDILLERAPADTISYSWRIKHKNDLQPRLLPDGSVGLYSADPALYGNLQIADEESQKLIDSARQKGDKTHLAFVLPAPYIKGLDGKKQYEDVAFSLKGDVLTLTAKNLYKKSYPLTIDPSIVVTTTNDFRLGFDDGMIDYATADQIRRSNISLGTTAATTAATALPYERSDHASVAYNGYIYVLGGYDGVDDINDVDYALINSDGSLGTWNSTTQMNALLESHTAVAYNGYMYVIGGSSEGTASDSVRYAPINTNGTLGSWSIAATFSNARYQHASAIYNGYLYVIGGRNAAGTRYNDVQYVPVNADGSLGSFAATTTFHATGRSSPTAVAYNGYLYVIGGYDGTTRLNTVRYAPINANGTVGTWVQDSDTFTTGRTAHTSVAYNGYLYVIGGYDGTNYYNDVQYAPLYGNGETGAWAATANVASSSRGEHASVVYNGNIYSSGGTDGPVGYATVRRAVINTGTPSFGTVGTWTTTSLLPARREDASAVAYNGHLYFIGGDGTNTVYRASVNADGTLGSWGTTTALPVSDIEGQAAVAYNGYMYLVGGKEGADALNTVSRASINSDGTLGSWSATTSFGTARMDHIAVAYNGYMYVMGGEDDGGTQLATVEYAPINSDGTIGTWNTTTAFTTARTRLTGLAYNGYMYVIGGTNGTAQSDVQKAPINANGTIGSWTATTALGTARSDHTSVAYNGYLYVMGGDNNSGSPLNDVQRALFNSDGTIGSWASTTAFTTARKAHGSVAYNGYMYIIGGNDSGAITSNDLDDVQKSSILSPHHKAVYERIIDIGANGTAIDSLIWQGSAVCGTEMSYKLAGADGIFGSATKLLYAFPNTTYNVSGGANKRYLWIQLNFNDSYCGTNSNVTDITVNYTAPPNAAPAAPTLNSPSAGATGVSLTPTFQMRTTDIDNDYLRYQIEVCSTSDCSVVVRTITQSASQTGWSGQDSQSNTAYVGNSTITSSTMASHTYQAPALNGHTQYWWRAYALDPGGTNTYSSASAIRTFTTLLTAPTVPTLSVPGAGATGVPIQPNFVMSSTDADGDSIKFKIEVCSTNDCLVVLRTIDQTATQAGWSGQDPSTGDYASGQQAVHTYQSPALAPGTQYWWRAYAIDPAGTNVFTSASSIQTFTTGGVPAVQINGGTQIRGGTRFGN